MRFQVHPLTGGRDSGDGHHEFACMSRDGKRAEQRQGCGRVFGLSFMIACLMIEAFFVYLAFLGLGAVMIVPIVVMPIGIYSGWRGFRGAL
jgi:hypothetical protein